MIARRQVWLTLTVALAGFKEIARPVDAKPLDDIARPAAPIGLARQAPFCREHSFAAIGCDMTVKIGFVAEQPKTILDFPFDARSATPPDLGPGEGFAPRQRCENRCNDNIG